MKKLIMLACIVIGSLTSCVAQYHHGHYPPQQRGRNTHQQRPPRNNRTNVQVHIGVNVPAVCPHYSRDVFRRAIIANKMYNPSWGGNPNLWSIDNPRSAFWPWRISRKPYKFYHTEYSTVYYTSTNLLMGVALDRQILVAKDGNYAHIYQNGRYVSSQILDRGYYYTQTLKTSYGWRLVEVFYDGACRVNYMDLDGTVLESYQLF